MRRRDHQASAFVDPIADVRRLRQKHRDRLLTLLTILLLLTMFVFAPLQAVDVFIFQGFAIAILLAIIGSMVIISDNPLALTVMSIVPLHPIARSLCNLESVIGQLYPATLLARLVTLELRQRS
ncbi:MAG TPA: hypothetical protein VL198_16885 [Pseudolabrys sp.]|jgi:hypothetical protein|nr:hypothetical protein [Pseudolabrys sp.]